MDEAARRRVAWRWRWINVTRRLPSCRMPCLRNWPSFTHVPASCTTSLTPGKKPSLPSLMLGKKPVGGLVWAVSGAPEKTSKFGGWLGRARQNMVRPELLGVPLWQFNPQLVFGVSFGGCRWR